MELAATIAGILFFFAIGIGISVKKLIVICQPSEVVVFSGRKRAGAKHIGYKALRGGRSFRFPLIELVDRMDLTNMSVEVGVTGAYTRDGVPINVQGVANVKIDGDLRLDNAVERLLGKSREEIMRIARETLEGNLRGVLAKLTPEQVNEDKESFAAELIEEAEVDLGELGLGLDTLKIQTVSDDVQYLDSIGRKKNAELIRKARIAEADRQSESEVQNAENLRMTRLAQLEAQIEIARAEAAKRIIKAETLRPAVVAQQQSEIQAQIARAEVDVRVQTARIEQVKLQLDADVITPAKAYKSEQEAAARAAVADIRESGRAQALGLEQLAKEWLKAGDQAKEIFLLEKLRSLVSIMVGTVDKVHVDRLTVVGGGDTPSAAGQVASLVEQLRSGAGIDVPKLLNGIGVGTAAVAPPQLKDKT